MRRLIQRVNPNRILRNVARVVRFTLFSLVGSIGVGDLAGAQEVLESDLRAAVIVGILRFTVWTRKNSELATGNELTICAFGDAPSAIGLKKVSGPIIIQDQILRFRRPTNEKDLLLCPVVVWGDGNKPLGATNISLAELRELGMEALVICDNCNNNMVGAAICLIREGDRIQFDINIEQARLAGVRFSSDLLTLARKVEGI
jgi:hypothetical protein